MNELAVNQQARPVAGDALLHPLVLLAIAVLVVNDHWLKAAWPGPITGKLSDFAGLLFFPLFLQAMWEVGSATVGRPSVGSRGLLLVVVVLAGALFSAVQLVPTATEAYEVGLGTLQWLAGLVPSALLGRPPQAGPVPVVLTPDPTDLVALPMLLIAYRLGLRRSASAEGGA